MLGARYNLNPKSELETLKPSPSSSSLALSSLELSDPTIYEPQI
jgi:hypothetical protein